MRDRTGLKTIHPELLDAADQRRTSASDGPFTSPGAQPWLLITASAEAARPGTR